MSARFKTHEACNKGRTIVILAIAWIINILIIHGALYTILSGHLVILSQMTRVESNLINKIRYPRTGCTPFDPKI